MLYCFLVTYVLATESFLKKSSSFQFLKIPATCIQVQAPLEGDTEHSEIKEKQFHLQWKDYWKTVELVWTGEQGAPLIYTISSGNCQKFCLNYGQ